jgi:S-adenosylmethionine hydrolase
MRPVVALLTDFGVRDHYAGTMKGVVLGICPETTLVDLSHDVPPHDILSAALELAAAYRYFPAGTVFLVVVDPGVGSSRRPKPATTGSSRPTMASSRPSSRRPRPGAWWSSPSGDSLARP